MIAIINYGMGNLGSMNNMFKRIGVKASIESQLGRIEQAEKLVLPGVGSFDAAMNRLNAITGLRDLLEDKVMNEKIPILGVCLGMQILTSASEEGRQPGLGWIKGEAKRFPRHDTLKVPHMGWNIASRESASLLTKNIGNESRYYFVHSYYVRVDNQSHSIMRTHYGFGFDSAIGNKNIYGVQFHPEKSHRFGMQILKNFSEI